MVRQAHREQITSNVLPRTDRHEQINTNRFNIQIVNHKTVSTGKANIDESSN